MQTFLPYPDFAKSAAVLDRMRLGKQRVEVLQLLRGQFPHHPCAKMWRGYEAALAGYGVAICDEWISRGYKDTCRGKILAVKSLDNWAIEIGGYIMPQWFGCAEFHESHRSNLKRKDPVHYQAFSEPTDLPYLWPILDLQAPHGYRLETR